MSDIKQYFLLSKTETVSHFIFAEWIWPNMSCIWVAQLCSRLECCDWIWSNSILHPSYYFRACVDQFVAFSLFTQYRTLSILVAKIGMVFVNSIFFEQEFIGAGNVTGSPSSMLRSCHSMLPRLLPGGFHLKSFRKIKFEFSIPIQSNVELAGFKKGFGKIFQTGFKKNVLAQSAGPYKNVSFLRPRIRAIFIAEPKFSYSILFWVNTSFALLSHVPSQVQWLVDCSNAINIFIFYRLTCVFKVPSIYYQLLSHLFSQCHKIAIEASVPKVSSLCCNV